MKKILIGREVEAAALNTAYQSPEAELISVIGRRRVGKTYLVRTVFQDKIGYELSGTLGGSRKQQLKNFSDQLQRFSGSNLPIIQPNSWQDAFLLLRTYLKEEMRGKQEKTVVFFDEVPWLSGKGSLFLEAFGYFWNSWASEQPLVVVLCGSSTSWMIRKVLKNKGGLHNRVTKRLRLKPFTLAETEAYLAWRNVRLDRFHLLQVYMAMGGIPHYLKEVEPGLSAIQIINQVCFSEQGLLKDEFQNLFEALFDAPSYHLEVVRSLANKHYGMTRNEILASISANDGGRVTRVLEELQESGFISVYAHFGNLKKQKIYRLTDEYTLFYLRFIEPSRTQDPEAWLLLSQTQQYKVWCGYAFENICLTHVNQIKQSMSIGGVHSTSSAFLLQKKEDTRGAQIDLILDRNDNVISLIEIKFHASPLRLTARQSEELKQKQWAFQAATETRKMLQWVMITPFGVEQNQESVTVLAKSLDMNALF